MRSRWVSVGVLGIVLLAVVMLASPTSAFYHSPAPAKPEPKRGGSVVEVKGWEFAFGPREVVVKPGAVTLRLRNTGRFGHNLVIEELGKGTTVIAPGETVDLSVTLREGTYTIYCAVRGHRDQGMEGTLVVRAGG